MVILEGKKGGEETTEETSEKSDELEGNGKGAGKRGGLVAAKAKRKIAVSVIGDYSCAANLLTNRDGVVKEWDGSLASRA